MNLSAPALPLILTFSPAAKNAAKEKGIDMCLRSVWAGSEARHVFPLPKIVQRFV
jgi:hypothetical protein